MEKFDNEMKAYVLEGDYSIKRADASEFRIWYTVYKNSNPYYRFDWEHHLKVIGDNSICFWIMHGAVRIGGVLMQPNCISGLYLIPPYSDISKVLDILTKLLRQWSDKNKAILAYGVMPNQIEHYQRLGYQVLEVRRCMIRPTETFDAVFDDRFELVQPKAEYAEAIADILIEANKSGTKTNNEALAAEHKGNTAFYFENYSDLELHIKASTFLVDKKTNKAAGVCLISSWEDWPLVYDIAVCPEYQKMGLAENMLKRAISVLKEEYRVIRLFVTVGNKAQSLYHRLGFLGGAEAADLYIPFG